MKIDIERLQIMKVEPGDTLVVTTKHRVSNEEVDGMRTVLAKLYPTCKVLVVDGGVEIKIIRGLK